MPTLHRVNTHVSDLFFNHDLESCKKRDERGRFDGWDESKLREEAESFLYMIRGLNADAAPTVEELIEDFHRRA